MRWLHISDLHFSESSAKQNYFENEILKREKPNFIVVTGDLRTYPTIKRFIFHPFQEADTFDQANSFLCRLLGRWGLSKNDIFIVPGNHDVDAVATCKELKVFSSGTVDLPKYENGKKSSFLIQDVHLSQRFSQYAAFIQRFFGKTHEAAQDSAGVFIRTWNHKINILHLNTALYSTKNNANE